MSNDLAKLQGTWHIVGLEVDGQTMPAGEARIVITGDRFTTMAMGAEYEGDLVVNETQSPKTFDLVFTSGPEKGNRSLGIYKLKDDQWKICLTVTGNVRPKAFATKAGSGLALETLERKPREPAIPAARDDREYVPVAELEGEWSLVSLVREGVTLEESLLQYGKRVDRGNLVTVSFGPQVAFKARYTADSSATPKTVDYIPVDGPNAGRIQPGIYELDGETLKLCYDAPGQPRPRDYTPGDRRTVAVWKRTKK